MNFKNIYNKAEFEHLYNITRQGFNVNKEIVSSQEVTQALMYVAQMLQKIAHSLSREKLEDTLDTHFPGTHLYEADHYDITTINSSLTSINQHVDTFLRNNPNTLIGNVDGTIEAVIKYISQVKEIDPSLSKNVEISISTFKVILNTFNNLIERVDTHNKNLDASYQSHSKIQY